MCAIPSGYDKFEIESNQEIGYVAQLYAVNGFRNYFRLGFVFSELDYLGLGRSPFPRQFPPRFPQYPGLDAVIAAMQIDFRNWSKNYDWRKCDAIGISFTGLNAELLEITTASNARSAALQITAKMGILAGMSNMHNLRMIIGASPWKPEFPLIEYDPTTFISFEASLGAPPGVVLYQVYRAEPKQMPVPVGAPEGAKDRLRKAAPAGPAGQDVDQRAKDFLTNNPDIYKWIRENAIYGLWAAVLIILALMGGAEVAALLAFALALVRAATA